MSSSLMSNRLVRVETLRRLRGGSLGSDEIRNAVVAEARGDSPTVAVAGQPHDVTGITSAIGLGEHDVVVLSSLERREALRPKAAAWRANVVSRVRFLSATAHRSADFDSKPWAWQALQFLRVNSHVLTVDCTDMGQALLAAVADQVIKCLDSEKQGRKGQRRGAEEVAWRLFYDHGRHDFALEMRSQILRPIGEVALAVEALTLEDLSPYLPKQFAEAYAALLRERRGGHLFSGRTLMLGQAFGATIEPEVAKSPVSVGLRFFPGHGAEVLESIRTVAPGATVHLTADSYEAWVTNITVDQLRQLGLQAAARRPPASAHDDKANAGIGGLPPLERTLTIIPVANLDASPLVREHNATSHPTWPIFKRLADRRRGVIDALGPISPINATGVPLPRWVTTETAIQIARTVDGVIGALADYDHRPLVADLAFFVADWCDGLTTRLRRLRGEGSPERALQLLEDEAAEACMVIGTCLAARLEPANGFHHIPGSALEGAGLKCIALVASVVDAAAHAIGQETGARIATLVTVGHRHQHRSEELCAGAVVIHLTPEVAVDPFAAAVLALHEFGHLSNVLLDLPTSSELWRGTASSAAVTVLVTTNSMVEMFMGCLNRYSESISGYVARRASALMLPSDANPAFVEAFSEGLRERFWAKTQGHLDALRAALARLDVGRDVMTVRMWIDDATDAVTAWMRPLADDVCDSMRSSASMAIHQEMCEMYQAFAIDFVHCLVEWQTAVIVGADVYVAFLRDRLANGERLPGRDQTLAVCAATALRLFPADDLEGDREFSGDDDLRSRREQVETYFADLLQWLDSLTALRCRLEGLDQVQFIRAHIRGACASDGVSLGEHLLETWRTYLRDRCR